MIITLPKVLIEVIFHFLKINKMSFLWLFLLITYFLQSTFHIFLFKIESIANILVFNIFHHIKYFEKNK